MLGFIKEFICKKLGFLCKEKKEDKDILPSKPFKLGSANYKTPVDIIGVDTSDKPSISIESEIKKDKESSTGIKVIKSTIVKPKEKDKGPIKPRPKVRIVTPNYPRVKKPIDIVDVSASKDKPKEEIKDPVKPKVIIKTPNYPADKGSNPSFSAEEIVKFPRTVDTDIYKIPKKFTKKQIKEKIESSIVNEDGINMYRIVMCWSMSDNEFTRIDKNRYHFVVDQDGNVIRGNFDVSDNFEINHNEKPRGTYATPTNGLNDNTISIAMLGMKDYKVENEKIVVGEYPINKRQYVVFCMLAYHLSNLYGVIVDLEALITKSEIEAVLKKKQKPGTCDFKFLPFDKKWNVINKNPTIVGKKIRDDIFAFNSI